MALALEDLGLVHEVRQVDHLVLELSVIIVLVRVLDYLLHVQNGDLFRISGSPTCIIPTDRKVSQLISSFLFTRSDKDPVKLTSVLRIDAQFDQVLGVVGDVKLVADVFLPLDELRYAPATDIIVAPVAVAAHV